MQHLEQALREGRILSLVESSLSRIYQHVGNPRAQFGHISAFRGDVPEGENKLRHETLKKAVTRYGYGFVEMIGGYREEGGPVQELSLFVPGIEKSEIVELGVQYGQYSVLWKGDGTFQEIGTNKIAGIGKVLNTFQAGIDINPAKLKDYWSRLLKGKHRDKKFLYVMERKSTNWWTEWRINIKQNGDDSELWVRIL